MNGGSSTTSRLRRAMSPISRAWGSDSSIPSSPKGTGGSETLVDFGASSVHHRQLGPVHGVAGEDEVADAHDPLAGPGQQHEVFQPLIRIVSCLEMWW